jgi:hypothetical protein
MGPNQPPIQWVLRALSLGVKRSGREADHSPPSIIIIIIIIIISGVGLSPPGTAATSGLLYKSQMIDEGDCGAIGGMKIGRANGSTRRKPAPAPLCPPQIPSPPSSTEAKNGGTAPPLPHMAS